jgi:hypothetical protein
VEHCRSSQVVECPAAVLIARTAALAAAQILGSASSRSDILAAPAGTAEAALGAAAAVQSGVAAVRSCGPNDSEKIVADDSLSVAQHEDFHADAPARCAMDADPVVDRAGDPVRKMEHRDTTGKLLL